MWSSWNVIPAVSFTWRSLSCPPRGQVSFSLVKEASCSLCRFLKLLSTGNYIKKLCATLIFNVLLFCVCYIVTRLYCSNEQRFWIDAVKIVDLPFSPIPLRPCQVPTAGFARSPPRSLASMCTNCFGAPMRKLLLPRLDFVLSKWCLFTNTFIPVVFLNNLIKYFINHWNNLVKVTARKTRYYALERLFELLKKKKLLLNLGRVRKL